MARARSTAAGTHKGIDGVREQIRAAGLRSTPARVAVLEQMRRARGPLSHADVSEALADTGFDRATIYRNLTELTEAGLLVRVELGDHVWRFEEKRPGHAPGKADDHPHFLCTNCGEVSCLDDVNVSITPKQTPPTPAGGRKPPGKQPGHRAIRSVQEVLLKGHCGKCGEHGA